ncbi:uncharacterized protein LOC129598169 [Paramacrobiotus metropolitanus]|uniref:uncharacterized protein LOC129598169 n=1 Tax=Paramacrobiotus metropolitanus TaxID=2943436 RepID=UPI0024460079|nr:uncharacterized protein LOC129598169 [Paramacrobiotus metropolitanus]
MTRFATLILASSLALLVLIQQTNAEKSGASAVLSRHKRDDGFPDFQCWTQDFNHLLGKKNPNKNCGEIRGFKGNRNGKDDECTKQHKGCCSKGDGGKCHWSLTLPKKN